MVLPDGYVLLTYMIKGRALTVKFTNGEQKIFAPSASVHESHVDNLLLKQATFGGCCGKPSITAHLFATQEQLESGERGWIE